MSNPTLKGTSVVMVDEFHERHLDGDLGLALLRRLQQTSRPDLRLVVMSATLDAAVRPGPKRKVILSTNVAESSITIRMIRAFGILIDNFPPDHERYGVPFPGTYLVDERGVVVAKYFEEDHRERFTTSGVLVKELGIGPDGRSTEVETPHLKVRYYASDETVRPGDRVTLVVDV